MHPTREEIQTNLREIIAAVKADIDAVEKFADSRGISISIHNENYLISSRLTNIYPILNLVSLSYFGGNGEESNIRSIAHYVQNPLYHSIKSIKIDTINENQLTIKTRATTYELQRFARFHGFNLNAFDNTIKSFQNGYTIQKLSREDFERFNKLANWTDENTQKILDSITAADKEEHRENCKRLSYNRYNFIHRRGEQLGISTQYTNDYLILKTLESK